MLQASSRRRFLRRFQRLMELPMVVLAFVWLALFVAEAVWGQSAWLTWLGWGIWAVFLAEFVAGLLLAPDRWVYLRRNWLSALALAAPALRVFRIFRVLRFARFARGTRFLRVISSANRSMGALGKSIGRRGAPYVLGVTLVVLFAGSAGMYIFENEGGRQAFDGYFEALWWTAMLMTSIGSEYWPVTAAGRVLCVVIAVFSFSVFGYITAALASFFVGRDAGTDNADDDSADLKQVRDELRALRVELAARGALAAPAGGSPSAPPPAR